MNDVSYREDVEDRALDDAIVISLLQHHVPSGQAGTTWFPERQRRHKQKLAELEVRKRRAAEAEAERVEKRTRSFVEGQRLWLDEIKDVKPLKT